MPAAEIVCTVAGIQYPLEIYTERLPDGSVPQQFLDAGHVGLEAVVKSDDDLPPALLFGSEDGSAFLVVNRHWFLADGVASRLQRTDDVLVVIAVNGGDDHNVGPSLAHHRVEVVEHRNTAALIADVGGADRIDVEDADQLRGVAELLHQRHGKHVQTASAGTR